MYIEGKKLKTNSIKKFPKFPKLKKKFKKIHTNLPDLLSKLSAKNNIEKFIHLSSLGIEKSIDSNYATSKLEGENKIKNNFNRSVILKPSVVYSASGTEEGSDEDIQMLRSKEYQTNPDEKGQSNKIHRNCQRLSRTSRC